MKIETATFASRADRTAFVAERFAEHLQGRVLDVGCFEAPMRDILGADRYLGIDIAGNPDRVIDLNKADGLPFEDDSFDTAMCIEVLEHLDNLHLMFGELVRVARRRVVVSLPNCWRDARRPVERGKGEFAHYGLPVDPPLDRHRWFFSATAAEHFVREQAARHGLDVLSCFATERYKHAALKGLRKLRYPGNRYLNRYAQTVYAVMAPGTCAPGS